MPGSQELKRLNADDTEWLRRELPNMEGMYPHVRRTMLEAVFAHLDDLKADLAKARDRGSITVSQYGKELRCEWESGLGGGTPEIMAAINALWKAVYDPEVPYV